MLRPVAGPDADVSEIAGKSAMPFMPFVKEQSLGVNCKAFHH